MYLCSVKFHIAVQMLPPFTVTYHPTDTDRDGKASASAGQADGGNDATDPNGPYAAFCKGRGRDDGNGYRQFNELNE